MSATTYGVRDERVDDVLTKVTLAPRFAKRVLRYELDRLCTAAGKTHGQAAERIGVTRSGFTQLLNKNTPSKPQLEALCDFFGRPDRLQHLVELLTIAKQKTATDVPTGSLADFELFLGLEAYSAVREIAVFEPNLVTGLCQTKAVAREVISYHATIETGVDVDAVLEARMSRQDVILRTDQPVELWFILDEQVLRRVIGSPEIMAEQIDHLLTLGELPNVNIVIVPLETPLHPGNAGAFTIFTLDDGWRVGYQETRKSAIYYDSPADIARVTRDMNLLRSAALDWPATKRRLLARRKELQKQ